MAADSGRELILEGVKDRLAEISKARGYGTSPVTVKRELPAAFGELSVGQLPALFVWDGDEDIEAELSRRVSCVFEVEVRGIVYEPAGGSKELNRLIRDVKKALLQATYLDIGAWESDKGHAERVWVSHITCHADRASRQAMFISTVRVEYREPMTLS